MSDMLINYILIVIMVVAAVYTVMTTRMLHSAIGLAITSAVLSILMFQLASPLAAVFELSVCAGLISAIFISTITLTGRLSGDNLQLRERERFQRFWLLPLLVIVAVVVFKQVPEPVISSLPAQPAVNDVRIIIWKLRHLDLFGQIVILLAGAFGVVTFFKEGK
jgi:NADH-quinone oxidoreductase subunit J